MCADTYSFYVTAAIRKLVGGDGLFSKAYGLDVRCMPPDQYKNDFVVQKKRAFVVQDRCATRFIFSPSKNRVFIAIHEE